jgi:hypothetical protein
MNPVVRSMPVSSGPSSTQIRIQGNTFRFGYLEQRKKKKKKKSTQNIPPPLDPQTLLLARLELPPKGLSHGLVPDAGHLDVHCDCLLAGYTMAKMGSPTISGHRQSVHHIGVVGVGALVGVAVALVVAVDLHGHGDAPLGGLGWVVRVAVFCRS